VYLWPQKFNMYIIGDVVLTAVLRIRIWIHRIQVFLGLLDQDPDLDPLVRGMDLDPDPDLDPSNIKQK
jgi:hypothetical protein